MPSKKSPFLVVVAGVGGNYHQKKEDLGEPPGTLWVWAPGLPKPLHRVSPVIDSTTRAAILALRVSLLLKHPDGGVYGPPGLPNGMII